MGLFILATSCVDTLEVENLDEPNKERVVVTPGDIEALIGGAFRTYWLAVEDWFAVDGLSAMADENTCSWGNAAMKDLSSEPRVEFNNTTAYDYIGHVEDPWFGSYSAIAAVNDGLRIILDPDDPVEIGEDGKDNPRAIAFGRFVQGISYAYLAAFFDQAYIIDETVDMDALAAGEVDIPLSPYGEVMDAAIDFLEKCITATAGEDFTTESSWVNEFPMTSDQLARLAHSYIARYMAAVARTPAERAAVDWASVKTHVNAGIQEGEDFGPVGDGYVAWYSDYRWITSNTGWTRSDYKTIGLTDTSGNYQTWLDTPVAQRTEFEIHTADRRITDSTATSDGKYFRYAGASPFRIARGTYHFSMYAYTGWLDYYYGESAPMTTLKKVEMDLLKAEAEYRLGNLSEVAELINKTRVANGELPPIEAGDSDLFKWLKYEKKIETYATASGLAYFDRRGWSGDPETGEDTDLVPGTPLHFPVPAKELEIGLMSLYTFGGGGAGSAPKMLVSSRVHPRNLPME